MPSCGPKLSKERRLLQPHYSALQLTTTPLQCTVVNPNPTRGAYSNPYISVQDFKISRFQDFKISRLQPPGRRTARQHKEIIHIWACDSL